MLAVVFNQLLWITFAPTGFLAEGRRRIRAFMRDPEYCTYLETLRDL
jgi:hypothetical protein